MNMASVPGGQSALAPYHCTSGACYDTHLLELLTAKRSIPASQVVNLKLSTFVGRTTDGFRHPDSRVGLQHWIQGMRILCSPSLASRSGLSNGHEGRWPAEVTCPLDALMSRPTRQGT